MAQREELKHRNRELGRETDKEGGIKTDRLHGRGGIKKLESRAGQRDGERNQIATG